MRPSHSWQFSSHGQPAEVLKWRAQDLPEPGPGQALVRIHAIGVNRSDLNYVLGTHFPARDFPSRLGGEATGEVIALGPPAPGKLPPVSRLRLQTGSRVGTLSGRLDRISMGVYRDIGLYDQAALAPIPEAYSYAQAAALWTGVITMAGAMEMAGFSAKTAAGKCVLITAGASGMGVLGLKLARHWGATTVATTRSPAKLGKLSQLADHVIVCDDSESLTAGMKSLPDGPLADLVLDPVGAAFFPGLLNVLAPGGDIVSYEGISGVQASLPIMQLMMKNARMHGYTTFRAYNRPALLDYLIEVGLDNADALRPEIARTFALTETPEALQSLSRSEHLGKLVIGV